MSEKIRTLELARLYERQGYYEDALEIYTYFDSRESGIEIQEGIKRMHHKLENAGQKDDQEKKISVLFEKWLLLLVLKQRLNNFIKIKKRLS